MPRRIRNNKDNRSIPTKVIDSAFDAARDFVRRTTGYLKKPSKSQPLTRKASRIQSRVSDKTKTLQSYRIKKFTVDAYDYMEIVMNTDHTEVIFASTNTYERGFTGLMNKSEFQFATGNCILYKIDSIGLTFTPLATNATYTQDDEVLQVTVPFILPKVKLLHFTGRTSGAATYMTVNPGTWMLNPNVKRTRHISLTFGNRLLYDQSLFDWKSPTVEYFPSNNSPRLIADIDTRVALDYVDLADVPMVPFSIHIQYNCSGVYVDKITGDMPSTELIAEPPIAKQNCASLLEKFTFKGQGDIDPSVDQGRFSQDYPAQGIGSKIKRNLLLKPKEMLNKQSHKYRRIGRRINQRWDKIFDPENCLAEENEDADYNTSVEDEKKEKEKQSIKSEGFTEPKALADNE